MGGLEEWAHRAVADLLQRLLGTFVKGIDAESLQLDTLGGDLMLNDLALRHEALEALDLPLAVADGRLGGIRVKVPWRNLDKERVIISIRDVFLLLMPKDSSSMAAAKQEELAIAAKRDALAAWEALQERKKEGMLGNFVGEQVDKLVRSLLQRLDVQVTNVHVRVQHGGGGSGAGVLAAGLVLRSLRVTDLPLPPENGSAVAAMGKAAFSAMLTAVVRKSVEVEGLGIYLTTPSARDGSLSARSPTRTAFSDAGDTAMPLAEACQPDVASDDWVLVPLACTLAVHFDPSYDSKRRPDGLSRSSDLRPWPQLRVEASFGTELAFGLRHAQLGGKPALLLSGRFRPNSLTPHGHMPS